MAFTAEQDRELISKLVRRAWRPLVFDKHFFLPDLARLGKQSVNMMNIVREPVARIISFYYFARTKGLRGAFLLVQIRSLYFVLIGGALLCWRQDYAITTHIKTNQMQPLAFSFCPFR